MPIVRQLPKIYVRGSLANVTMKNLTSEQKNQVNDLVQYLIKHEKLQSSKSAFIRALKSTIAADYKDDLDSANSEFLIPVWNAVVQLLFHKNYKFHCKHCQATQFIGKDKKTKDFDRTTYIPCPVCKHTQIITDGTPKIIHIDEIPNHIKPGDTLPQCYSIIEHTEHGPKHPNAKAILEDESQLIKFVSSYIQNYEKQILRENKPAKTIKQTYNSIDSYEHFRPLLINLLNKYGCEFTVYNHSSKDSVYVIDGLATHVNMTDELLKLASDMASYQVIVTITNTKIVLDGKSSNPYSIKERKSSFVSINDESGSSDNKDNKSSLDHITGGYGMRDDHTEELAIKEGCAKVRKSLSNNDKDVFDILYGSGDIYDRFVSRFGEGKPCNGHMAAFLGRNRKSIKESITNIKHMSMTFDLIPTA